MAISAAAKLAKALAKASKKKAGEFDEAAWLEANPRPEGNARDPAVNAWNAKKWRAANPDRVTANNKKHWQIAKKDPEKLAKRQASTRAAYNKDKGKKQAQNAKWKQENAERYKAQQAEYYRNNPRDKAKNAANQSKTRAKKKDRIIPWSDPEKINEIYRAASDISRATGVPHEVDHVIPLLGKKVSGLHHQDNLLVVPMRENRAKHNTFEPGDLPPRAGVRKSRAYLKKIREELGLLGPIE